MNTSPLQLLQLCTHLLIPLSTTSPVLAFELATPKLTSKSGRPVSRYGLGGAARSTQPASLPSLYLNEIVLQSSSQSSSIAPFYFYYNPHRYPNFMQGIKEVCGSCKREDLFIAGGGSERGIMAMEQRLSDCLDYCGGEYLDLFILEYIEPHELEATAKYNSDDDTLQLQPLPHMKPKKDLQAAIQQCDEWLNKGLVRYIGISTHSHAVGTALSYVDELDVLMLRYGMSHKESAEKRSFPACRHNKKSVIAFTTTRWNALQGGLEDNGHGPTSADCLSFVFSSTSSPPVEAVLHSARDEEELLNSMRGMKMGFSSSEEEKRWREYGAVFEELNDDGFDEYPEER